MAGERVGVEIQVHQRGEKRELAGNRRVERVVGEVEERETRHVADPRRDGSSQRVAGKVKHRYG